MRARKLLKISAITLATLGLTLLFLVAFFLFNPFEGSLGEMRDVVPRSVDFFVQKANLREDFTLANGSVDTDAFPYVPGIERVARNQAWAELKRGSWYKGLGITEQLVNVRRQFEQMKNDISFLHLVDDLIGREVQIAGRFGPSGLEDSAWCMYTRVSWRGKAAYGAMAHGLARDELKTQGVELSDDEAGFYKIKMPGEARDMFIARYRDCMMIANDRGLVIDSMELADGNRQNVEPLGTSAHYKDGVLEPLLEWKGRTGVERPNVVELHLLPNQLFPKLPDWRNWPNAKSEDRNEKILASFINLKSWRFLSGSMIFENNSITALSHLVVNPNELTGFQRKVHKAETEKREDWMNEFFRMVPRDACGAAALKLPAGDFISEMVKDALVPDEIDELNNAIKRTGKYQGLDDLISKMQLSLRPRVGILLRPNRRSEDTQKKFKVKFPSPFPQWAWVFWVKKGKRSGQPLNKPLKDLITQINENRRAFAIANAFKLGLTSGGVKSDVAFEFSIPDIPGTGSIAACTLGEYFICGNSGPFIHRMVDALVNDRSRRGEKDFNEFVLEMPQAVNGVVFAWGEQLIEVANDFKSFARTASEPATAEFGLANRPTAERTTFRQTKWRRYGTKARIPAGEKEAFEGDVDREVDRMWAKQRQLDVVGNIESIEQFRQLVGTFRSAYLQMVLTDKSLKIWGRVLSPEYR